MSTTQPTCRQRVGCLQFSPSPEHNIGATVIHCPDRTMFTLARLHAVLTELKQHISDEWDKIDQQLIDSAIKQLCKRLAACVSTRGGHTEHTL